MTGLLHSELDFVLPPELEAAEPPEARGLRRDQVRLMVTGPSAGVRVTHARFHDLPDFLSKGDVVVINTSGTRNAALPAVRSDGTPLELHLSTYFGEQRLWTVEVRSVDAIGKTKHFGDIRLGEQLHLPAAASALLQGPYVGDCDAAAAPSKILWTAALHLPLPLEAYLERHGFPIRYNYVREKWPLSYYQTVYATESGSAEMPSAGRPFTPQVLEQLASKGVQVLPLILHTGISNLESHELPYKEYYRVPSETASAINEARIAGRRVVAVGTTVVRALETATDASGKSHGGEGWTCLVVTPQRGVRLVTGLLTGLHEPEATHLAILEALAGASHIQQAYREALNQQYLWHEFGDLHLLLP